MAQNSQAYQHYIHDVPVDPGFPRDFKFILVESIEQLRELLSEPVNLFGFDIETTGLNSETDDIVSFSFCKESHVGYNVPVDHDPVVNGGNPGLGEEALDLVYEFMRDKARWVAIHNFAFESRMMEWHGFTSLDDYHKRMWLGLEPYVENEFFTQDQVSHYFKYDMGKINYFDTMVSCWLSDTNDQKTGLKKYEEKFLGWRSSSFEDTLGDNVNFKFTNYRDPSIIEYTCLDAIGAYNLAIKTKRFYDEAKTSGKIDMKFIYTIMRGSTLLQRLDPVVLKNYEDELSEHLYKLEQECWSIAGQPFNLKSPKDKARIFELLGLNTGEVGKAGVMKTGKELLNKLKKSLDKSDPNYKLLDNITQFGILSTVKNTFVKNLLNACESGGYRENFTRFNYKTTHVPCLTENNYVVIRDKGLISIKDVLEGDYIWTQYGFKKVLWNNSHMSDDVYRVTLYDGSFIEGTGHHPVLVNLNKSRYGTPTPEWSGLTSLRDKELVIKNSHLVEDFDSDITLSSLDESLFEGSMWNKNTKSNDFILPTKMTPKLARLIGFLDGDGSISNSELKLCFHKDHTDLYDYYTNLVKDLFGISLVREECFNKRYGRVNGVVARVWCPKVCSWLQSLGVRGDSISSYILNSNPECWKEYLAGFFDSDGRVSVNLQVRIKTVKKQRMIDCQTLLSMLGVNSLFRVRDKDRVNPIYEVYVSTKDWIVRFAMLFKDRLVCSYKREACNKILEKYSEYFDLNQSNFVQIDKVENSLVYDIEVEDVHEYVANGIVTHNTGRLSAAGDKKSLGFFSDLNIQNIPKPHPADYHAISIQDAMRLNPELVELGRGDEPGSFKDVWYYQTSKRNCKIVRIMGWLFTQVYWKNIVVDADGHTEKWPDDFPFNNEFENPMIEEGADQHLNIRSAMLPFDDDDYILSLDYSGQELKAAAMLSREPVWFDAFANGDDAHKQTAYAIFGKENYDKEKRKLAKGLNFGIIYGMEAYSIYSRGMAKTPEEAEDFYTKFKDGLPVLFNWLDSVVQEGKNNGTVYTMFGRPRRVKYWLDNDNFKFKAFGARTCKNTVVQGTGADITKTALNRVFDNVLNVPKNKTIVRFMSTVHDEVNYSVKKKYFSSVAKTINKLMTIWIDSNDRFPFDTGLGIGLRWGELFDFDYDKKTFDILHPKWDPLPPKPVEYVVENSEEEVVEETTYDFSKMFEGLDEDGSNEF